MHRRSNRSRLAARSLTLLLPSLLALTACSGTPEKAEWSYEGSTGPEHWADLSEDYALARTGRHQSPVDIERRALVATDLPRLDVHYEPHALAIFNNGHTVEDEYTGGGYVMVGGHRYDLAQFHVHSPSEHTVDGQHAAIEVHLVHKDADGNLGVVAVLVEVGQHNPMFEHLGPYMPLEPGRAPHVEGVTVDATGLLPDDRSYFHYSGSLTTPPCTEGVEWFVLRQPVQASAAQVEHFRQAFYGNNRPTQALHDRRVEQPR